MTIIALQKQIEEVRESFRQKLLEAAERPQKVMNSSNGEQQISLYQELILYVQTVIEWCVILSAVVTDE